MSSSDNLMTMIEQPWSFRTTFADSSWTTFPDMFHIKETETLTQALHRTISNDDSPLSHDESGDNNVVLLQGTAAFPVPTDNELGHVSKQNKKSAVGGPTGRVTKRKSRASKRQATTFIAADPANFREMVQQVTGGVRFGGLPAAADLMMRPEPLRPAFDGSSGFLLGGSASFVQPRQVDLDSLCSFPTLESSKVHF